MLVAQPEPPPAQLSDARPEAWSSGVAGASALAFNWFCHDERSSRVIAVKILPLRALSLKLGALSGSLYAGFRCLACVSRFVATLG